MFEVVAIDEDDHTIEIQHFDATIEEVDLESWAELLTVEISAPEDWSGSVDMIARVRSRPEVRSTMHQWVLVMIAKRSPSRPSTIQA